MSTAPPSNETKPLFLIWLLSAFMIPTGVLGLVATQDSSSPTESEPAANKTSDDNVPRLDFPSIDGVASFKASRWADPRIAANKAREFFNYASKNPDQANPGDRPLNRLIQDLIADGKLIVLMPTYTHREAESSGDGDATASTEDITKTRHAVEIALTTAGFETEYPDRMSYIHIPQIKSQVHKPLDKQSQRSYLDYTDAIIPLKLFRYSAPSEHEGRNRASNNFALVLWLDEDYLCNDPWDVIDQVLKTAIGLAACQSDNVKLAVIGPSSSNTLRPMLDLTQVNAAEFAKQWKERYKLFITRATVDIRQLRHESDSILPNMAFMVGDDAVLHEYMRGELNARNAWPSTRLSLEFWRKEAKILVLTESDSKYTKSMERLFTQNVSSNIPPLAQDNLVYLSFDKGLTKTPTSDARPTAYFEQAIERLLDSHSASDFVAVALLATDPADKVVLMKVAKPLLPGSVFFAFDFDEVYHDPKNIDVTRNLVLASHFGPDIKLSGELAGDATRQLELPAFSQSQQTSTFLAAYVALRAFQEGKFNQSHWKTAQADSMESKTSSVRGSLDLFNLWNRLAVPISEHDFLHPLVFEIGRRGPVQLNMSQIPSQKSLSVSQSDAFTTHVKAKWILIPFFFMALGIVAAFRMRGQSGSAKEVVNVITPTWSYFHKLSQKLKTFLLSILQDGRNAEVPTTTTNRSTGRKQSGTLVPGPAPRPESISTRDGIVICISVTMFLGLLLATIIAGNTSFGEPLTWSDGISAWPSLVILFAAGCIAFRSCFSQNDENKNIYTTTEAIRTAFKQALARNSSDTRNVVKEKENSTLRLGLFLCICTLLIMALCYFMFDVLWRIPARGKLSLSVGYIVTVIGWVPIVYLACITLASGIIARHQLKSTLMEVFDSNAAREEPLVTLNLPQLVVAVMKTGDLTRRLGFEFMLPSFLVGTIAFAMSTYLDAWSLGFAGIGVAMLPLWFSVYSYRLIRNAAIRLRDHSISVLQDQLVNPTAIQSSPQPNQLVPKDEIRSTIDRLRDMKQGSLGGALSDPVLGGILAVVLTTAPEPVRAVVRWLLSNSG